MVNGRFILDSKSRDDLSINFSIADARLAIFCPCSPVTSSLLFIWKIAVDGIFRPVMHCNLLLNLLLLRRLVQGEIFVSGSVIVKKLLPGLTILGNSSVCKCYLDIVHFC